MSHNEWQFMSDKELDTWLRFAQAHVQRALSDEHVEHFSAQVQSILQEKRLRNIIKEHGERTS